MTDKNKKDKKKKDPEEAPSSEKELQEHPPYPDIRPRALREPLDQPQGPEDKEAI